MKRNERGALTVEAVIFLFIFMFGMLALLNLVNMVRTQVMIQNALNQSAKEVSQYSYIFYRLGYLNYLTDTNAAYDKSKGTVDGIKQNVEGVLNGDDILENVQGLMKTFNDGAQPVIDTIVTEVVNGASVKMTNTVNQAVVEKLAQNSMDTYFSSFGKSSEEYLKKLGVVDGKLDYEVEYCKDQNRRIAVCVNYKMEYKFPFIDIHFEKPIHLTAVTAAWAGGK